MQLCWTHAHAKGMMKKRRKRGVVGKAARAAQIRKWGLCMDYTRTIAEFIANATYEDLPQKAIDITKTSIIDTLGCMVAASSLAETSNAVYDSYRDIEGDGPCTIIGYGERMPLYAAAFVNGAMGHGVDFDDCASIDKPTIHPTASVFPAAFTLSEHLGGITGKDLILAVAIGNEVGIRIGDCPQGDMLKDYCFFSQTVIGVFQATAAACKLLNLDVDQTVSALGLAINRVSGPFHSLFTCDFRGIRDAFCNEEGIKCAMFAKAGLKGCVKALDVLFDEIYKGDVDMNGLTEGLGTVYKLADRIGYKPWPSCGSSYPFVQGILEIMAENGLTAEDVERVVLTGCQNGLDTFEPKAEKSAPTSSAVGKSALPYIAALAVKNQTIALGDFTPEAFGDLEVRAITDRIDYVLDNSFTSVEGRVEIQTVDGRSFVTDVKTLRGSQANPVSEAEVYAKFLNNCKLARKPIAAETVEGMLDALKDLENQADLVMFTEALA